MGISPSVFSDAEPFSYEKTSRSQEFSNTTNGIRQGFVELFFSGYDELLYALE